MILVLADDERKAPYSCKYRKRGRARPYRPRLQVCPNLRCASTGTAKDCRSPNLRIDQRMEMSIMTISKLIASLIGPTLVAGAIAVLLNLGTWPALVEQGFRDSALIFESGFPLLVAGLAIVRVHNRWENNWPVLVTLVGWLALLGGLSRIMFPTRLAPIAAGAVQTAGVLPAVAILFLMVGAFLAFKGYSRE